MTAEVLSLRALNRATLERQLLLQRSTMRVRDALEHLIGLQAQLPQNPYVGLWSRLRRFGPDELGQLLVNREAVRIVVMRGTLHLVTADDCLAIRPLVQPVLDQELARHAEHGPTIHRVDLDAVLAFARPLLTAPHTGAALRAALQERFPDHDAAALAYACRNLLGLVQVPPRGLWRRSAQIRSATAASWIGRPFDPHPSIDALVLRYLGAFGPASVADVAAWSGLTGLGEVVDRLAPVLRKFRDERGRPLVDLPDAPRPDPDTPSPPRFLPEYDNVLLSHADRTRFRSDDGRRRLSAAAGPVHGSVLCDGLVHGTWRIERDRSSGASTLLIQEVAHGTKRAAAALSAEGRRFLRFIAAGAEGHDVRVVTVA